LQQEAIKIYLEKRRGKCGGKIGWKSGAKTTRYTASQMEADMHAGISGCLAPLVQLPRPLKERLYALFPSVLYFFFPFFGFLLSVEISSFAICPCKFFEKLSLRSKNLFFSPKKGVAVDEGGGGGSGWGI